ncbi:MAG TPA: TIGR01777 family oxidoreductase [Micromonosporaceae bacterium]|nr:TIGR01777 family oxidoreductase [Micromonosporaceae bacterium]
MRFVIAGSSGFLGTRLVRQLRAGGHDVVRLVRREPRADDEIRWNPTAGALDPQALVNADVAVNLAGAGVGDHRWTRAYRKTLIDSRVDTTTTLARALASTAGAGPRVLVNASGISFYGAPGDRAVDEQSPPGDGFLAELTRVWEAATGPAEAAGVRVAHLRSGLPLSPEGGLLKPLMLPFRLGLGAKLGNGRQYLPWISMADWLGAVELVVERADIAGPVNMVGPTPATNAEFTRALGRALGRPAIFAVPGPALRLGLGEAAGEALASLRAVPGVLNAAGYRFQHRDVEAALRAALDDR